MKAILVTMMALMFGVGAQADDAQTQKTKIKQLADQFHQQQYQAQVKKDRAKRERRLGEERNDHTCACGPTCGCATTPPSPVACVEFVCKKLGSFGCDEQAEVIRVVRACRGNYGYACAEEVCKRLGSFGCDEIGEVEQVTSACRGNVDGECIKFLCGKLGSFGCDEIKEIVPIAKECAGL